jgi:rfaE bifunctional protein nucleotidyltransferase chain/domain
VRVVKLWRRILAPSRSVGKIISQEELSQVSRQMRSQGEKLVFTNGCFDLLHPGHVRLLEKSRSLGNALAVAINNDASVRAAKGAGRPVVPEHERAEVLAALSAVDFVCIFGERTPRELIAAILPAILVKGADWGANEIVGREDVEGSGGQVVSFALEEGFSTTRLIEKVRRGS